MQGYSVMAVATGEEGLRLPHAPTDSTLSLASSAQPPIGARRSRPSAAEPSRYVRRPPHAAQDTSNGICEMHKRTTTPTSSTTSMRMTREHQHQQSQARPVEGHPGKQGVPEHVEPYVGVGLPTASIVPRSPDRRRRPHGPHLWVQVDGRRQRRLQVVRHRRPTPRTTPVPAPSASIPPAWSLTGTPAT